MVPYARGLVAAGHTVAFCVPNSFIPSVEKAGFQFLGRPDIAPDKFRAVLQGRERLSAVESNTRYVREVFGRLNLEAGLPTTRTIIRDWQPDLVVRETAEITSLVATQESGIPLVEVAIGLLSGHKFMEPLMSQALAVEGLTAAAACFGQAERLSAVPPSLEELAPRAGATHRFREEQGPLAALPDWWPGSTDPLVYMTLGSEAARMGLFPMFYRALIDSVASAPIRVLFTLGAADPAALGALPANVHLEAWWPQDSVLAQASAVVAHGGYGTMVGALAAGLPSVNLPLFAFDQHANARRLEQFGAGVQLLGPDAPIALAPALMKVLADDRMRSRAQLLKSEIAAMPPAAEAVAILERIA